MQQMPGELSVSVFFVAPDFNAHQTLMQLGGLKQPSRQMSVAFICSAQGCTCADNLLQH